MRVGTISRVLISGVLACVLLNGCRKPAPSAPAQGTGGAAWPRSAPVPRKDAFFGLHFDLHPGATDTSLGADISEDNIRDLLERVRPDYVQYDCKGHAGLGRLPDQGRLGQPGHRQGQPGRLAQGDPRRRRRAVHPLLRRLGHQGDRRAPRLGPGRRGTASPTRTSRASSAPTSTSSSSPSSRRSPPSTASTASGPTASAGPRSSTVRPPPSPPGRKRPATGTRPRTAPTRAGSNGRCSTAGPSSGISATGSTPSTPRTRPSS